MADRWFQRMNTPGTSLYPRIERPAASWRRMLQRYPFAFYKNNHKKGKRTLECEVDTARESRVPASSVARTDLTQRCFNRYAPS